MPVFDVSGNLKVAGDRAGNISVQSSGVEVVAAAQFINFTGAGVSSVAADGIGVEVTITGGSGSTPSSSSTGGSGSFTKGIIFSYPLTAQNVVSWRAESVHTMSNIRGFYSGTAGGSSASLQVARNGSDLHLSATMNLTSNNTWFIGGGITTPAYSPGDYMQVRLTGVSGTIVYVTLQADFSS